MNKKTIDTILQSVGLESLKDTKPTIFKWKNSLDHKRGVSVDGKRGIHYSSNMGIDEKVEIRTSRRHGAAKTK